MSVSDDGMRRARESAAEAELELEEMKNKRRRKENALARRHVPGLRSVARPFVRLRDEGCSDRPSRSSRTEDEPWRSIAKRSSRLM